MASDRAPRTPTCANREGMEGIDPRWRGWIAGRGCGGNPFKSMSYSPTGGDGGDGGDICNPPRARARISCDIGLSKPLSCEGLQNTPPSPPSPPACLQAIDLASVYPFPLLQSIPSLSNSIPSIPSEKKEGLQGKVEGEGASTKSSDKAWPCGAGAVAKGNRLDPHPLRFFPAPQRNGSAMRLSFAVAGFGKGATRATITARGATRASMAPLKGSLHG